MSYVRPGRAIEIVQNVGDVPHEQACRIVDALIEAGIVRREVVPAAEHGTRTAYQRCRLRPEGSCLACRMANAEYQNERNGRLHPGRVCKRRRLADLTPLPGGGVAEREWKRLSPSMRRGLLGLARLPRELPEDIGTYRALNHRGLLSPPPWALTPRGRALADWTIGAGNDRDAS